jgi:hypothetical protein
MPITRFLNAEHFEAETQRVMRVAFEAARASLHRSDVSDRVVEIVAKRSSNLPKPVSMILMFSASGHWRS